MCSPQHQRDTLSDLTAGKEGDEKLPPTWDKLGEFNLKMQVSETMHALYTTGKASFHKVLFLKIKHLPFHSELGIKEEYGISQGSQVTLNMSFRPEDLSSSRSLLKNIYFKNACGKLIGLLLCSS